MNPQTRAGRLSTVAAALVVARRDFRAVLWSRSVVAFLAGPLFMLGDKVNGGFYGAQPSLTDLSNGDLVATTDFRDVYGTVLRDVLGADGEKILDGHSGNVDGLLKV